MGQRGFTLIELMITVAILAILLSIGVPSFTRQIQHNRMQAAAEELFSAIQLARNTAVGRNQRVTLRHLGTWETGWQAFADNNNNGVLDADEDLLFSSGPLRSVRISGNGPVSSYVSFVGTGESRKVGSALGAIQMGTIDVCSTDDAGGYALVLFRSGRVRIREMSVSDCAPPPPQAGEGS